MLAAERRQRDGRHGADLAVSGGDGLLLDRRDDDGQRRAELDAPGVVISRFTLAGARRIVNRRRVF